MMWTERCSSRRLRFFKSAHIMIVILALYLSGTKAENTCKKGCSQSDNGILQYTPGNVYEYNFDTVMTVGLHSGEKSDTDDTGLSVVGTAKLFPEGNCGYTLQLSPTKVTATKDSVEKMIVQSIQKPVHFIMTSGKLDPEICVDSTDDAHSLNIKRAIISLLQSNTESQSEVDVFGQCATHTSVSKISPTTQVVTKMRNLNSCAYREKISSGIVTGLVNEKSEIKSALLFEADYAKESKIESGIIANVQLVEEYKFSNVPRTGVPNIRAKVSTSLKLKTTGTLASPSITDTRRASIIFEKPDTHTTKNIAALKTALAQLVQLVGDYVHKDSAKSFVELIRLMRHADTETLLELGAVPHPNKNLARKVYLDALFRTGTPESARAIFKQLNKFEEKERSMAILSLNLLQNVDKDTLNQAAALLNNNADNELFLAVGGLVSKYCKRDRCLGNDIEVISKKFTDVIKNCKAHTKKDEERIIYVLKGIANSQHLAESVSSTVAGCVAPGRSSRIRVAALQTLSAASCNKEVQHKTIELLKNQNEDSEIRIEAYLAAIQCPTPTLANEIADIVNSEKVNQVGGFISSNLRTIRDSTDSMKERQRQILGNIRVTKIFPKDVRRYSFNNELSYKFDTLGASGSTDYKLIYSQNGFLPRSGRLNVTTEVFGTDFNILEASIRQENIENVLEYYVGPKGLLNKDFEEIMKMIEIGGAGSRTRRSIADDTTKFSKKYSSYGSKGIDNLNLDLSLKLFGTEMLFLSLGDHIPSTLDDVIKYVSIAFEEVKKELSDFNKEFIVHSLFLDTEFMYPTGLGLPLELSAQGFSANKLEIGLNADVDAILEQNWQQAKYRVKAVPSIDIILNLKLNFNAYVLSTGLNVISSLHSATGSDVVLTFLNDGQGFNVDIVVPREKIELINLQISSNFFIEEEDKPTRALISKNLKKKKPNVSELCFNQVEDIGVTICVETNLMDLNLNENGHEIDISQPLKLNIYLTTELKYNFKGRHLEKPNGVKQWILEFKTPGSKESHDTSLSFELGTLSRKYTRVAFDNSKYHWGLEAGFNNDNKELVFYGQHEHNGDIKKNRVGFIKNGNEYRPIIEIQKENGVVNNINGYKADGRVVLQKLSDNQARYKFENLAVSNKENDKIVVNGYVDLGPASFNSELKISPGQNSYLVNINFKLESNEYAVGLFVTNEKLPDNVAGGSVLLKVEDQKVFLKLLGKINKWEIDTTNKLHLVKNEDTNTITSTDLKHEIIFKHKQNVVGSFKLYTYTEDQRKLKVSAEIARNKMLSTLNILYDGNQQTHIYLLEVNGKLNAHFVDLESKLNANGNHFVVDSALTTSWGTSVTAKGEVGQRFTLQDAYVDLQGAVQLTGKGKLAHWLLKIIGTPEKTISECKVSSENVDIIKFNGETQHPQEKITAGKVNLIVKNVVSAKADFKVAKNGKGEVTTNIETLNTEPKHKIDVNSKFHIQAPKYDVETSIIFDVDKSLHFKTENIVDKAKFTTKNVLEGMNKKISFDADGLVKGEWRWNGEIEGNFVLQVPNGHNVNGNFKRKLTTNPKTGVAQGEMHLKLNEQLDSGKKRSVDLVSKVDKLNLKHKEVSAEIRLDYTDFENKKLNTVYRIKHLPKGQNKFIDFAVTAGGELIPEPLEGSLIIDEYSESHAVFRLNGKYGNRIIVNFNGNYNLAERSKPASYGLQANVQAPDSTFKTFELHTNGKLLKPATEGGTYVVEFNIDERVSGDQFAKINVALKCSQRQASYNVNVESKNLPAPLKMDGSFLREQTKDIKESSTSGKQKFVFNYNFGEKFIKTTADISYVGFNSANLQYTLDSSFDSAKDITVEVRSQRLDTKSYNINIRAKQQNNVFDLETKLHGSSHKKGIEVRGTLPNTKPIVFVVVFDLLGERKAKLNVEIENFFELDLKTNSEAIYTSIDDFQILADWNSSKLQLNNYNLEVRSQGKTITLNLKHAQGIIFAGSATYVIKREKNKATIEGQGQLQYKEKMQNTNFKLVRQVYETISDKEVGFSYTFNGSFGPKNAVSTFKITNKDFNIKLSVCEQKKQCTNVQIQSIVSVDDQESDSTLHSLLMLFDLRELGYPYEFELQSKTIRQGFNLQYNLDSKIIANKNLQYQLIAKVLPTNSKVQIKIPSREILLETTLELPQRGKLFGHYENSIAFYFDKLNKPNDVTRFISKADVNGVEKTAINAKGEIRFEHPSLRPYIVKGVVDANREHQLLTSEVVLDIFRTPEQKIVVTSRIQNIKNGHGFNLTTNEVIRSNGFDLHYEFDFHAAINTLNQELSSAAKLNFGSNDNSMSMNLYGNREKMELVLNLLNENVLELNGDINKQKHESQFVSKLKLFGKTALESRTSLQPTNVKVSVNRPGYFEGNIELKLGKELIFNANGLNKNLIEGRIELDAANFLQTTYKRDDANINSFLDNCENEIKKETEIAVDNIKLRFQNLRNVLEQHYNAAKTSIPDFSALKLNYETNINEILEQLENDPSLKKIAELFHKMYRQFAKIAGDFSKYVFELYENVQKLIEVSYGKIEIILKDTVIPIWEKLFSTATKIVGKIKIQIINFYSELFRNILEFLEKYNPQLKTFGKAIAELMKPFKEGFSEFIKVTTQIMDEQLNELKEFIGSLPTFEAIQQEFISMIEKYKITEKVLEVINGIFDHMHILPQTPETIEFLSKAQEYIQAKLKQQSVNDEHIVEELFKLMIKALQSIWSNIQLPSGANLPEYSEYGIGSIFDNTQLVDILTKIPAFLSFRFSVFNFLLNEDFTHLSLKDHLKSWIFFNDFDLEGHIADGRHIFTFDGQYISFPGSCKYILTQDSVDNNFTVIGNLNNGKLKSVTLIDRENIFLEINDAGALKLNGNPIEFPVHTNGMHAWRLFYTVYLRSEYGVEVMCTSDLKVCHVDVNGFYTSKTRGLLGNGNAEPLDDFILPDGTLASDYAVFGNSYGLGKCNPVTHEPQEMLKRSDLCNELFGYESTLALGYLSIDVTPYRTACDNAVTLAAEKDKEVVACNIATAYGSALKRKQMYVFLPSQCLKCAGNAGQREIGQEFTVKVPSNKADIVFVVDVGVTPIVLNNLVAPTITEVRDTLKNRGFTDIQIVVIAYNETERYPALLTSNNGKINYQGNIGDVILNGPTNFCENCLPQLVNDKKIRDLYELFETIVRSIVPQSDEKAFKLALNYPFRAAAAKSIVAVRSNTLEYGNLLKVVRAHVTGATSKFDNALLHMIAPVQELALEGIPSEKLVGFNSRLIATLDGKDAKKRQKLQFKNDMGIDFVLNNGGWVFNSRHFNDLKSNDQKKVLNQVTNSIADSLFKTEIVSDCQCWPVHGIHAQHKCSVKSLNFIGNKKVKANK